MAAKDKLYYRGVWVAANSATAQSLAAEKAARASKHRLDEKLSNAEIADRHRKAADSAFEAAMADYHQQFPNKENENDPRAVSSRYRSTGV